MTRTNRSEYITVESERKEFMARKGSGSEGRDGERIR